MARRLRLREDDVQKSLERNVGRNSIEIIKALTRAIRKVRYLNEELSEFGQEIWA